MRLSTMVIQIAKRIKYKVNKYELNNLKRSFNTVGSNLLMDSPFEINSPGNISIGNNFHSCRNIKLSAITNYENELFKPKLSIGNNVFINAYCHIACAEAINIGNNVLIASKVYIADHAHGKSDMESLKRAPINRRLITKPISIGDNVWIGEGASILMGVIIGDNCIIGANALVNKSFPPNSVIGGVPAKLIKFIS